MKYILTLTILLLAPLAIHAQCQNGDLWKVNTSTKLMECVAPAALPVSSAGQSAMDLKAPLASPAFTGTVSGITPTMVGLGNVTNTSDSNKPVSTAQQTALDLKANLASPSFTGTVTMPASVKLTPVTISGLPTCNSGAKGSLAVVTDALLPAFLVTVGAGGAITVPVLCNGSNWVVY
jgi:hypothetical protein